MRDWISKGRGLLRFYGPSDDGKSGGGGANGGSSGVGAGDDPFKDIPLDELDEATRTAITKGRAQIATLQSLPTELEATKKQLRDFQSKADQMQAQLKKLTGGDKPVQDDYLQAAKDVLKQQGYDDKNIDQLAPVFANLLKSNNQILKKELGADLRPMAGAVISQESRAAFETAQEADDQGILGIPEVAEQVWQQVQERSKQGQPSNDVFILNLAKIAYVDHVAALRKEGKELPALQPTMPTTPNVNTGSFTYPGARASASARPVAQPADNGTKAKSTLNADTEAALAATFKELGRETKVFPKQFTPAAKK